MKTKMKIIIASLAMVVCLATNPAPAFAQAETFQVTLLGTLVDYPEPPVIKPVGPLNRITVTVLWYGVLSEFGWAGPMEITGSWVVDPRDGSATGHGTWTWTPATDVQCEGKWAVDGSGTMHSTGFVKGGELDGALMTAVSVAGDAWQGWMLYESRILVPARK